MLKKRIIFSLLWHKNSFMLSRNFHLQSVGSVDWLAQHYNFSNIAFAIDELVILDVARADSDPTAFCDVVKAVTRDCFVPVTAGGNIRDPERARQVLRSGADKVLLNTALAQDAGLVRELSDQYGRQCVIAAVDVRREGDDHIVYTAFGTQRQKPLRDWLEYLGTLPIGEVYINSIDRDGTGQGFDLGVLDAVPPSLKCPLILAGGAGKARHFEEALSRSDVDACATAHLFNFVGDGLVKARAHVLDAGLNVAQWDIDQMRALQGAV